MLNDYLNDNVGKRARVISLDGSVVSTGRIVKTDYGYGVESRGQQFIFPDIRDAFLVGKVIQIYIW